MTGTLFGGFGFFHAYRMKNLWSFYPAKEKVFNLAALGAIFLLSSLSFNAAYQIHQGQTMQHIEMQPPIWRRLTGQIDYITPQDRQAYLEKMIKLEEERVQVEKMLKK